VSAISLTSSIQSKSWDPAQIFLVVVYLIYAARIFVNSAFSPGAGKNAKTFFDSDLKDEHEDHIWQAVGVMMLFGAIRGFFVEFIDDLTTPQKTLWRMTRLMHPIVLLVVFSVLGAKKGSLGAEYGHNNGQMQAAEHKLVMACMVVCLVMMQTNLRGKTAAAFGQFKWPQNPAQIAIFVNLIAMFLFFLDLATHRKLFKDESQRFQSAETLFLTSLMLNFADLQFFYEVKSDKTQKHAAQRLFFQNLVWNGMCLFVWHESIASHGAVFEHVKFTEGWMTDFKVTHLNSAVGAVMTLISAYGAFS
jgi:hypothetical protein